MQAPPLHPAVLALINVAAHVLGSHGLTGGADVAQDAEGNVVVQLTIRPAGAEPEAQAPVIHHALCRAAHSGPCPI